MDLNTLKELKLFDVEVGRWKWFLKTEVDKTNLPDFIKASMSIEDMIELVLKNNKELTGDKE